MVAAKRRLLAQQDKVIFDDADMLAGSCPGGFSEASGTPTRRFPPELMGALPVVSALEFFRSGHLGAVAPGMTETDVRRLWGEPTSYRLTRPPSRIYGPVWLFVSSGVITHGGIYIEDLASPGPPGFVLDLPVDSEASFTAALEAAKVDYTLATDEMEEGEPEVVLRAHDSGVLAVFDKDGRLACIEQAIPRERSNG